MNTYKESIQLGQAKNQATELLKACYLNNTPIGIITKLNNEGKYYKDLVKLIYKLNKELEEEVFKDARMGDSK